MDIVGHLFSGLLGVPIHVHKPEGKLVGSYFPIDEPDLPEGFTRPPLPADIPLVQMLHNRVGDHYDRITAFDPELEPIASRAGKVSAAASNAKGTKQVKMKGVDGDEATMMRELSKSMGEANSNNPTFLLQMMVRP